MPLCMQTAREATGGKRKANSPDPSTSPSRSRKQARPARFDSKSDELWKAAKKFRDEQDVEKKRKAGDEIEWLLERGHEAHRVLDYRTPLTLVVRAACDNAPEGLRLVKLLIEHGALVNDSTASALPVASAEMDKGKTAAWSVAELLLSRGALLHPDFPSVTIPSLPRPLCPRVEFLRDLADEDEDAELHERLRPLTCPITLEVMNDPVVASDGHSYERHAIRNFITRRTATGRQLTSPVTGGTLTTEEELIPNHLARSLICYMAENNGFVPF